MDSVKIQKLPSEKRNKLRVPAYFTIEVEYDCVQAESDKPVQELILQEYKKDKIEHCKDEDQMITIPLSTTISSNVTENGQYYKIDISSESLKIFEGKTFSILVDPMDGNPPVLIRDEIEYSKDLITKLSEQKQPEISELKFEGSKT